MQERQGEFYQHRDPVSFSCAGWCVVVSVALVLGVMTFATWAKSVERDPYAQLGFVTPNNVTVVPKGPRGMMKDIPAIKRALDADVRRVEA